MAVSRMRKRNFQYNKTLTMHLFLWRPAPMPNPPAMMNYSRHQIYTSYNVCQH